MSLDHRHFWKTSQSGGYNKDTGGTIKNSRTDWSALKSSVGKFAPHPSSSLQTHPASSYQNKLYPPHASSK